MQSKEKKTDIFLSPEFSEFIRQNVQKDSFSIALSSQMMENVRYRAYLQQLRIYQKALYKLPEFVEKKCIFTVRSYEQSSSQATALFKARFVQAKQLLDLSGGLGVDDWAFALVGADVQSVDPDEDLNEMAIFNFNQLGVLPRIQRITSSAEQFLHQNPQAFDCVYCDADRRPSGVKTFDLSDGLPDVVTLLQDIYKISDRVLIKASPMADIVACVRQLHGVQQVLVVAWQGEVRELLFLLNRNYSGDFTRTAFEVGQAGEMLHELSSERPVQKHSYADDAEKEFFYEPSPAVIKADLVNMQAGMYGLERVGKVSSYLLGTRYEENFWGRVLKIERRMNFQASGLVRYLKECGIKQANVAKRDFPLKVVDIRKKFNLKDGGDDYFFFTTNTLGEKEVYHCLRYTKIVS